jgi:hypothetical protein
MNILSILEKIRGKWRLPIHLVQWYPSNRSCSTGVGNKRKPTLLPPLMVRRAEWRR